MSGDRLLDPWGRPYHFTFSKRSRYWDRVNVSTYYDYTAAKEKRVTEVTPVTQEMAFMAVSSYGPTGGDRPDPPSLDKVEWVERKSQGWAWQPPETFTSLPVNPASAR